MAEAAQRPLSLHPLVGHEAQRAALSGAHARGVLPSALLLHGPRGVGKQRLALWLAQLLVCQRPAAEPCGRCGPCRMALSLEHPDVHWYFPLARPKRVAGDKLADALEEARLQALADIRARPLRSGRSQELRGLYVGTARNIRAAAHKRPIMAEGPVFVIGEAELLVPQEASQEAANALLKLLEEPPGGARFVLTSSEPGHLLPTIRSRTVPMHVGALPLDTVRSFLSEHAGADAAAVARAAELGQGSIGRALGFLPVDDDEVSMESLRLDALELVLAATASDPSAAHAVALSYPPSGARKLVDMFGFVEEWLRDLAAVAIGAPDRIVHRDMRERLERHVRSAGLAAADVPIAFSRVEAARELARGNVNPQLVVSGLMRDLRAALVPGRRRPTGAAR